MGSHSPVQVALYIIAFLALVGVIITFIRTRMTFAGYEEVAPEIRRLNMSLRGEVFRDGPDVVISGVWDKRPTVVRFSNEENTPGINVRMAAPAFFQLSVAPAGVPINEGPRTAVKTIDEMFDARFTTRTDAPAHARMLISRTVMAELQKLACGKNTFLMVGSGAIELSELVIPEGNPAHHIAEHLKSMTEIAATLRKLPGAEAVKLATFKKEHHLAARIAMAAGIVVAVFSIIGAMQFNPHPLTGVNRALNNGILPIDANVIADAPLWHAATVDEMDAAGVDRLRANGIEPSGRVEGDFTGSGTQDEAYLLVNAAGQRRLVIIAGHQVRYDSQMPALGFIARIPRDAVDSITWKKDLGPREVGGDGILLVQHADDPESGVVLFVTPTGIASAAPASWRDVPLH